MSAGSICQLLQKNDSSHPAAPLHFMTNHEAVIAMFDNEFLQKLSTRAAALFPAAESARLKLEQDLYALLQSSLSRLNVVTREEFDAQMALLERAQTRMAALELKLEELEQQVKTAQQP